MSKKVDNPENAYKEDKLAKIPTWIKIILLKYWVACAAFYFWIMGGNFLWFRHEDYHFDTTLKIIAICSLGYAIFKEYIEKNIIRYMRTSVNETKKYNLINLHGTLSFVAHLFYCLFLTIMMTLICTLFITDENMLHLGFIGYGPFTVGFVYLILDLICIGIKDGIVVLVKHIKYKRAIKIQNMILAEDDIPTYGEASEEVNNELDNFTNKEE